MAQNEGPVRVDGDEYFVQDGRVFRKSLQSGEIDSPNIFENRFTRLHAEKLRILHNALIVLFDNGDLVVYLRSPDDFTSGAVFNTNFLLSTLTVDFEISGGDLVVVEVPGKLSTIVTSEGHLDSQFHPFVEPASHVGYFYTPLGLDGRQIRLASAENNLTRLRQDKNLAELLPLMAANTESYRDFYTIYELFGESIGAQGQTVNRIVLASENGKTYNVNRIVIKKKANSSSATLRYWADGRRFISPSYDLPFSEVRDQLRDGELTPMSEQFYRSLFENYVVDSA